MKKLFLAIVFVLLSVSYSPADYSDYCDGWAEGYVAGYCYDERGFCREPWVPMCPLQRVGEETYQDGYNRGFVAGQVKKDSE